MKIDMTNAAQPTIDASDLATLFGLEIAQVQGLMRDGKITTLLETGIDEDAGKFRLTFTHANKRVRLSCDASGHVTSTVRTPVGLLDVNYDPDYS